MIPRGKIITEVTAPIPYRIEVTGRKISVLNKSENKQHPTMRASFKSELLVFCQICDMHNCMSNTNYKCPSIDRFPLKTADQILCKIYHRILKREVCDIHILTVIL